MYAIDAQIWKKDKKLTSKLHQMIEESGEYRYSYKPALNGELVCADR